MPLHEGKYKAIVCPNSECQFPPAVSARAAKKDAEKPSKSISLYVRWKVTHERIDGEDIPLSQPEFISSRETLANRDGAGNQIGLDKLRNFYGFTGTKFKEILTFDFGKVEAELVLEADGDKLQVKYVNSLSRAAEDALELDRDFADLLRSEIRTAQQDDDLSFPEERIPA